MKRALSVVAVIGWVLASSLPGASGAEPKAVIEDPLGDANFINDQGTGDGSVGDQTPADAGTVSDITAIRMSNDSKNLYVQIDTEAAPPAATGIGFRIRVNPEGAGGTHCLFFEAFFSGANNIVTTPQAHFVDSCGGGTTTPVDILGMQLVIPRDLHDAFGKGATLAAPQAQSFLWTGTYPQGVAGPFPDTTKVGTDYKFIDKKK
ncbi:MAG TPA: hypothetical protein VNC78_00600 [Actinomycetota bacterium]|nr:hypothetical protein [Actinomycetota bacterium]